VARRKPDWAAAVTGRLLPPTKGVAVSESSEEQVEEAAQEMETDAQELEDRTDELGERIEDVRSDWDAKKADSTLATGPPVPESAEGSGPDEESVPDEESAPPREDHDG